jgi:hypothetical protein
MKLQNKGCWAGTVIIMAAAYAIAAPQWGLSWHTMDTGGAMRLTGGSFELSGTIAQPDASAHSGGPFTLSGGFWFEIMPGDCTEDGGVTLFDHAQYTDCAAGPEETINDPTCTCVDVDGDSDVDLADYAVTQSFFSGN